MREDKPLRPYYSVLMLLLQFSIISQSLKPMTVPHPLLLQSTCVQLSQNMSLRKLVTNYRPRQLPGLNLIIEVRVCTNWRYAKCWVLIKAHFTGLDTESGCWLLLSPGLSSEQRSAAGRACVATTHTASERRLSFTGSKMASFAGVFELEWFFIIPWSV